MPVNWDQVPWGFVIFIAVFAVVLFYFIFFQGYLTAAIYRCFLKCFLPHNLDIKFNHIQFSFLSGNLTIRGLTITTLSMKVKICRLRVAIKYWAKIPDFGENNVNQHYGNDDNNNAIDLDADDEDESTEADGDITCCKKKKKKGMLHAIFKRKGRFSVYIDGLKVLLYNQSEASIARIEAIRNLYRDGKTTEEATQFFKEMYGSAPKQPYQMSIMMRIILPLRIRIKTMVVAISNPNLPAILHFSTEKVKGLFTMLPREDSNHSMKQSLTLSMTTVRIRSTPNSEFDKSRLIKDSLRDLENRFQKHRLIFLAETVNFNLTQDVFGCVIRKEDLNKALLVTAEPKMHITVDLYSALIQYGSYFDKVRGAFMRYFKPFLFTNPIIYPDSRSRVKYIEIAIRFKGNQKAVVNIPFTTSQLLVESLALTFDHPSTINMMIPFNVSSYEENKVAVDCRFTNPQILTSLPESKDSDNTIIRAETMYVSFLTLTPEHWYDERLRKLSIDFVDCSVKLAPYHVPFLSQLGSDFYSLYPFEETIDECNRFIPSNFYITVGMYPCVIKLLSKKLPEFEFINEIEKHQRMELRAESFSARCQIPTLIFHETDRAISYSAQFVKPIIQFVFPENHIYQLRRNVFKGNDIYGDHHNSKYNINRESHRRRNDINADQENENLSVSPPGEYVGYDFLSSKLIELSGGFKWSKDDGCIQFPMVVKVGDAKGVFTVLAITNFLNVVMNYSVLEKKPPNTVRHITAFKDWKPPPKKFPEAIVHFSINVKFEQVVVLLPFDLYDTSTGVEGHIHDLYLTIESCFPHYHLILNASSILGKLGRTNFPSEKFYYERMGVDGEDRSDQGTVHVDGATFTMKNCNVRKPRPAHAHSMMGLDIGAIYGYCTPYQAFAFLDLSTDITNLWLTNDTKQTMQPILDNIYLPNQLIFTFREAQVFLDCLKYGLLCVCLPSGVLMYQDNLINKDSHLAYYLSIPTIDIHHLVSANSSENDKMKTKAKNDVNKKVSKSSSEKVSRSTNSYDDNDNDEPKLRRRSSSSFQSTLKRNKNASSSTLRRSIKIRKESDLDLYKTNIDTNDIKKEIIKSKSLFTSTDVDIFNEEEEVKEQLKLRCLMHLTTYFTFIKTVRYEEYQYDAKRQLEYMNELGCNFIDYDNLPRIEVLPVISKKYDVTLDEEYNLYQVLKTDPNNENMYELPMPILTFTHQDQYVNADTSQLWLHMFQVRRFSQHKFPKKSPPLQDKTLKRFLRRHYDMHTIIPERTQIVMQLGYIKTLTLILKTINLQPDTHFLAKIVRANSTAQVMEKIAHFRNTSVNLPEINITIVEPNNQVNFNLVLGGLDMVIIYEILKSKKMTLSVPGITFNINIKDDSNPALSFQLPYIQLGKIDGVKSIQMDKSQLKIQSSQSALKAINYILGNLLDSLKGIESPGVGVGQKDFEALLRNTKDFNNNIEYLKKYHYVNVITDPAQYFANERQNFVIKLFDQDIDKVYDNLYDLPPNHHCTNPTNNFSTGMIKNYRHESSDQQQQPKSKKGKKKGNKNKNNHHDNDNDDDYDNDNTNVPTPFDQENPDQAHRDQLTFVNDYTNALASAYYLAYKELGVRNYLNTYQLFMNEEEEEKNENNNIVVPINNNIVNREPVISKTLIKTGKIQLILENNKINIKLNPVSMNATESQSSANISIKSINMNLVPDLLIFLLSIKMPKKSQQQQSITFDDKSKKADKMKPKKKKKDFVLHFVLNEFACKFTSILLNIKSIAAVANFSKNLSFVFSLSNLIVRVDEFAQVMFGGIDYSFTSNKKNSFLSIKPIDIRFSLDLILNTKACIDISFIDQIKEIQKGKHKFTKNNPEAIYRKENPILQSKIIEKIGKNGKSGNPIVDMFLRSIFVLAVGQISIETLIDENTSAMLKIPGIRGGIFSFDDKSISSFLYLIVPHLTVSNIVSFPLADLIIHSFYQHYSNKLEVTATTGNVRILTHKKTLAKLVAVANSVLSNIPKKEAKEQKNDSNLNDDDYDEYDDVNYKVNDKQNDQEFKKEKEKVRKANSDDFDENQRINLNNSKKKDIKKSSKSLILSIKFTIPRFQLKLPEISTSLHIIDPSLSVQIYKNLIIKAQISKISLRIDQTSVTVSMEMMKRLEEISFQTNGLFITVNPNFYSQIGLLKDFFNFIKAEFKTKENVDHLLKDINHSIHLKRDKNKKNPSHPMLMDKASDVTHSIMNNSNNTQQQQIEIPTIRTMLLLVTLKNNIINIQYPLTDKEEAKLQKHTTTSNPKNNNTNNSGDINKDNLEKTGFILKITEISMSVEGRKNEDNEMKAKAAMFNMSDLELITDTFEKENTQRVIDATNTIHINKFTSAQCKSVSVSAISFSNRINVDLLIDSFVVSVFPTMPNTLHHIISLVTVIKNSTSSLKAKSTAKQQANQGNQTNQTEKEVHGPLKKLNFKIESSFIIIDAKIKNTAVVLKPIKTKFPISLVSVYIDYEKTNSEFAPHLVQCMVSVNPILAPITPQLVNWLESFFQSLTNFIISIPSHRKQVKKPPLPNSTTDEEHQQKKQKPKPKVSFHLSSIVEGIEFSIGCQPSDIQLIFGFDKLALHFTTKSKGFSFHLGKLYISTERLENPKTQKTAALQTKPSIDAMFLKAHRLLSFEIPSIDGFISGNAQVIDVREISLSVSNDKIEDLFTFMTVWVHPLISMLQESARQRRIAKEKTNTEDNEEEETNINNNTTKVHKRKEKNSDSKLSAQINTFNIVFFYSGIKGKLSLEFTPMFFSMNKALVLFSIPVVQLSATGFVEGKMTIGPIILQIHRLGRILQIEGDEDSLISPSASLNNLNENSGASIDGNISQEEFEDLRRFSLVAMLGSINCNIKSFEDPMILFDMKSASLFFLFAPPSNQILSIVVDSPQLRMISQAFSKFKSLVKSIAEPIKVGVKRTKKNKQSVRFMQESTGTKETINPKKKKDKRKIPIKTAQLDLLLNGIQAELFRYYITDKEAVRVRLDGASLFVKLLEKGMKITIKCKNDGSSITRVEKNINSNKTVRNMNFTFKPMALSRLFCEDGKVTDNRNVLSIPKIVGDLNTIQENLNVKYDFTTIFKDSVETSLNLSDYEAVMAIVKFAISQIKKPKNRQAATNYDDDDDLNTKKKKSTKKRNRYSYSDSENNDDDDFDNDNDDDNNEVADFDTKKQKKHEINQDQQQQQQQQGNQQNTKEKVKFNFIPNLYEFSPQFKIALGAKFTPNVEWVLTRFGIADEHIIPATLFEYVELGLQRVLQSLAQVANSEATK